jgi:NTP pyrophosphatase (non-canonical NTP hydrolase)
MLASGGHPPLNRDPHGRNIMHIREFQQLINQMYSDKDRARGAAKTFLWLTEEFGELAQAIAKRDDPENLKEEFADVLAWLVTLANVEGVDLEEAIRKFTDGCPGCGKMNCDCQSKLT